MTIRYLRIFAAAALICAAAPAQADLKYYPDPVHRKLSDDDPPAMSDMTELALEGDTRAMFILGDMYEKGKGGLPKDLKESRKWFEESGMHGYGHSFIRLAAMAKLEKKPIEAWQWYTLAIRHLDNDDTQNYAIQARKALEEKFQLTSEDIAAARDAQDAWEDARDQHLRDEAKAMREAAAAAKEEAARLEEEERAKAGQEQDKQEPKQEE
jgi:TPR repeat protein